MFVSKERVTRDGYLIAYEGEEMSDEEAALRGLLTEEQPANEAPEEESGELEEAPEENPEPEEKPVEKPKRKPRGKAVEED